MPIVPYKAENVDDFTDDVPSKSAFRWDTKCDAVSKTSGHIAQFIKQRYETDEYGLFSLNNNSVEYIVYTPIVISIV